MQTLMSPIMTHEEALEWKSRLSSTANQLRLLVFEGYERRAWEALGHGTWTDCLKALADEYRFSERQLWRLHAANQTEHALTHGSVGTLPERTLRPLTGLPPAVQRRVWKQAVQQAPQGIPTAAQVETAVWQHRADHPRPQPRMRDPSQPQTLTPTRSRPLPVYAYAPAFDKVAELGGMVLEGCDTPEHLARFQEVLDELQEALHDRRGVLRA